MASNSWEGLISSFEPTLRRAFVDSVHAMRDRAQIDQIVRMLEAGRIEDAIRAVGLDPVSFRPLDKAISEAFEAGGEATAKLVPITRADDGLRTVFQFGVRNPVAEAWLAGHSATLVREILDDQRSMIRGTLTDAMSKGLNPRTAALDLVGRVSAATGKREGGTLGLTQTQTEWVKNYADDLASENPLAALSRKLRDRRFDGAVRKAAKAGEPVPAELRGKMVLAFKNRALRMRAEAIARSEAITALHEAQRQALDQAVASGAVRSDIITMTWRSARDSKVRDAHRELDGTTIKRGETFRSSLGPIRFPGDPQASAANRINCRCFLQVSADFLANVR